MNLQMQRIQRACEELKLPGIAAEWPALADRAAGSGSTMTELL